MIDDSSVLAQFFWVHDYFNFHSPFASLAQDAWLKQVEFNLTQCIATGCELIFLDGFRWGRMISKHWMSSMLSSCSSCCRHPGNSIYRHRSVRHGPSKRFWVMSSLMRWFWIFKAHFLELRRPFSNGQRSGIKILLMLCVIHFAIKKYMMHVSCSFSWDTKLQMQPTKANFSWRISAPWFQKWARCDFDWNISFQKCRWAYNQNRNQKCTPSQML